MPVYQEVTILFSLTHWMETVLVRKYFMRYSNFVHKLNSQLWLETRLLFMIYGEYKTGEGGFFFFLWWLCNTLPTHLCANTM